MVFRPLASQCRMAGGCAAPGCFSHCRGCRMSALAAPNTTVPPRGIFPSLARATCQPAPDLPPAGLFLPGVVPRRPGVRGPAARPFPFPIVQKNRPPPPSVSARAPAGFASSRPAGAPFPFVLRMLCPSACAAPRLFALGRGAPFLRAAWRIADRLHWRRCAARRGYSSPARPAFGCFGKRPVLPLSIEGFLRRMRRRRSKRMPIMIQFRG